MDIKAFAKKPQLIEITLDDQGIVESYGETIKFWMYDYVDISTYFDFFKSQREGQGENLNTLLRSIILNAEGQPAIAEDEKLPVDISVAALTKISETLGKSKTKSSMKETGTQPS
jgi:hypothetical protein